jgi:hypothetical protein
MSALLLGIGLACGPRMAWAETRLTALSDLVGKQVTVQLQNGSMLQDVEVTELKKGDKPGHFRGMTVNQSTLTQL